MHTRSVLPLLFVIISAQVMAQEISHEFGKISKDELTMKSYNKDTDAEAVVIYDIGETSFFLNNMDYITMAFERKTRIKILTKAGIGYADISVPYYVGKDDQEIVKDIEAVSYNSENGSFNVTHLDPKDIFDQKISANIHEKKFAIPDVKPGTVIEYRYRIESPYFVHLRDWDFQWTIPVEYSQYIAKMVPFYQYTYFLQGATKFDSLSSHEEDGVIPKINTDVGASAGSSVYKELVHTFVMRNLPAFRDESFITTDEDYLIKVYFQLSKVYYLHGGSENYLTTWPDLADKLLKNQYFGKYLNDCQKIASRMTLDLNTQDTAAEKKIGEIVNYVKSNYTWNGENSIYVSQDADAFMKSGTGNSADINLFLVALLNKFGFNAYPVILSTRNNGKIKSDYPYLPFFNYVIAGVPLGNSQGLFDASAINYPNNEIPIKCINDRGFIITKHSDQWIDLSRVNYLSKVQYSFNHDMTPDGDNVREKIVAEGQNAAILREDYPDEKSFVKERTDSRGSVDSVIFVNRDVRDKPFSIFFESHTTPDIIGKKMFISPFLDEPVSKNPFSSASRQLPIDLINISVRKFVAEITIPAGYQADYIPTPIHVDDSLAYIDYKCLHQQNRVMVIGIYFFKRNNFPAGDYQKLKAYMNEIIKSFNDKIVISKNS